MWSKIKWYVFAGFSALMTFLGFVYGKRTPPVARARLRADDQRERILRNDLEKLSTQRAVDDAQAATHLERAAEIDQKIGVIRERRRKLDREMRSALYLDDDELALRDNARLRSHSVPGA